MTCFFKFKIPLGVIITFDIFETREMAAMCDLYTPANSTVANIRSYVGDREGWRKKYEAITGGTVLTVQGDEMFFLISKEKADIAKAYYFHVIVGEKFGWIIVPDWLEAIEINGK